MSSASVARFFLASAAALIKKLKKRKKIDKFEQAQQKLTLHQARGSFKTKLI